MNITNFIPYETVELELDKDVEIKLKEHADSLNMSIEDLIRQILINTISQEISLEEFSEKFKDVKDDELPEFLTKYWIIKQNDTPIARCIPISYKPD
jgi:hypothetical protein